LPVADKSKEHNINKGNNGGSKKLYLDCVSAFVKDAVPHRRDAYRSNDGKPAGHGMCFVFRMLRRDRRIFAFNKKREDEKDLQ
jgi:hypothetical protein